MADHAIVVGIQTYPGLQDLKGPCNDAESFRDWLLDSAGGNLDPANVKVLLSTDFPAPTNVHDARPTTADLQDLFRPHITAAAKGDHIGERLFIFVAGHGFADPQDLDSAALFTAEAEFFYPLHSAVMHYVDFLHKAWAFDELIVLMDSCRTTNPIHEIGKPALPRIAAHQNSSRVKRFVGYGSAFSQAARERDFNGSFRGVFSMTLLEALHKAEPNHLGRVTGTAVKKYVHNGIKKFAENVDPDIDARHDKDVLFVTRPSSAIPISFQVDSTLLGKELVVRFGGQEEVYRGAIAASPVRVTLTPGLYAAVIEGTEKSAIFEVPVDETVTI